MNTQTTLVPYLWFDKEAFEAASFYVSLFPNSQVTGRAYFENGEQGSIEEISFLLDGQPFVALSAGPYWKINPSVSFILNFDPLTVEDPEVKLKAMWAELSVNGEVRMPLGDYGFSKLFGWVEDRFGVNWQLMLTDPKGEPRPFITPAIMFQKDEKGNAHEARELYSKAFKEVIEGPVVLWGDDQSVNEPGTVMYSDIKLNNMWLALMDDGYDHQFSLNGAISFMVLCKDQATMDGLYENLSEDPETEQCGWLKDKVGVSWQIRQKK